MKFETEKAKAAHRYLAGMINQMEEDASNAYHGNKSPGEEIVFVMRNVIELRMQALELAHRIDLKERMFEFQYKSHSLPNPL